MAIDIEHFLAQELPHIIAYIKAGIPCDTGTGDRSGNFESQKVTWKQSKFHHEHAGRSGDTSWVHLTTLQTEQALRMHLRQHPGLVFAMRDRFRERLRLRALIQTLPQRLQAEDWSHTIDHSRARGGRQELRLRTHQAGFAYTSTCFDDAGKKTRVHEELLADADALESFLLKNPSVLQFVY